MRCITSSTAYPGSLSVVYQERPTLRMKPVLMLQLSDCIMYAPFERTFFEIRVIHPNCDTNTFKPLYKIYKDHEEEKKDLYEERVLQSERKDLLSV